MKESSLSLVLSSLNFANLQQRPDNTQQFLINKFLP